MKEKTRLLAVLVVFAIITPVVTKGIYAPIYADTDYNEDGDYDDPGERDEGGGDSGGDTGPSPEEVETAEAHSAWDSICDFFSAVADVVGGFFSSDSDRVSDGISSLSEVFGVSKAPTAGDPVLVTTGRYLLEEQDISIPDSSFAVTRRYMTEEQIQGRFGNGWASSLDSRIIRGSDPVNADSLAGAPGILNQMEALAAREWVYPEAIAIGQQIDASYYSALSQYESALATINRAALLKSKNSQAMYANTPEWYQHIGNENITVIDEQGMPLVFIYQNNGRWLPENAEQRLTMVLTSVNGQAADTGAGFVLTVKGGIKKHYNGGGLLTAVEELDGDTVTFTRDSGGRVTGISGPHGNIWTVSYSGNFISKISGPEGQSVSYGYSGNMLSSATDMEGDTAQYTYEDSRLKRIVKPDGSYIELTYGYTGTSGAQLVSATRQEEGGVEHFDYNLTQKVTTYTNHSGVVTKFWYDDKHRIIREEHGDGAIKTFSYNSIGLLERETINGDAAAYQYDDRGNMTVKQYSDGTKEQWAWNSLDQKTRYIDRDGVTAEWVYDGKGNCTSITQGGQAVFSAAYDSRGLITLSREGNREAASYTHDSRGYIAGRTVTANGQAITERWVNDALGRVTEYTDGAGRKWTYTYNKKSTIEKTPTGLQRTYTYNSRKDLASVRETDTLTGEVREQAILYDKRHLAVKVTDGAGAETEYTYRDDGLMTGKKQGPWTWEYGYDSAGRLSSATMGMEGSAEHYTEQYGYTRQGAFEQRSVITTGGTTVYQFDPWGRVTGVTNALGEISNRALSGAGRVVKEQGAAGGNFAYTYDSLGRIIGAGRENDAAVQVSYNNDGTIAEKTDRNGVRTQYGYDGRGLLIQETTQQGEIRYQYDGAGRVVYQEIRNANTAGAEKYYTAWEYNDAARTVKVAAGGLYQETWYLNAWGEAVRKTGGLGNEQRWQYDGAGNLTASIDGYGKETLYAYNAIGKVAGITYPDGSVTAYEYNHLGQAVKITDGEGVQWQGGYDSSGHLAWEQGRPGIDKAYRYDALGRVIEVKSGGEVTEQYAYENRGRKITFSGGEGASFIIEKNEYAEAVSETNRLGDRQSSVYDKEGRRVSATAYSGKQVRTVYDDSRGTTTTQYADGTSVQITRDLGGNILSAQGDTGIIRYRYDAGGRLIWQRDEAAGETTEYQYDAAGRRTRMRSGNRDVGYTYGKNGELLAVIDNSQRLMVHYQYDAMGRETKRVYGNGVSQETYYDRAGRTILIRELGARNELFRAEGYVYDDKGRRVLTVDENGAVTKYEYDNQSRLSTALYPWTEEKALADKQEAEEAGLFFSQDKGNPERYTLSSAELSKLREVLNRASYNRGALVAMNQTMWREGYAYDANGNRASKTTPWGTIRYDYDRENRLISKGTITYTYDKDGNLLTGKGSMKEEKYEYNGQNRMTRSEVTDFTAKTRSSTAYEYDAYGRRTITQETGGEAMRTLYDGFTFETIREGVTFANGGFTTNYTSGMAPASTASSHTEGSRYRWIDSSGEDDRNQHTDNDAAPARYTGINVTLYGRGEAVAMNYTASSGVRGGSAYLGKDILGSVRSVSGDYGMLEDRYEYDAFGKPYAGDLSSGMSLGYTGKPYDTATGMYDYGYRDYKPENARFTTVDPVRDGANWFAYVNNDPVNYFDPFGLTASEPKISFSSSLFVPTIKTEVNLFEKAIPTPVFNSGVIVPTEIVPAYFLQNDWSTVLGQTFANNSCAATTIMNEVSKDYTQKTGTSLSWFEGNVAMKAAVDSPNINNGKSEAPAYVNNWTNAANTMWQDTGQTGNLPNAGTHTVYAVNTDKDPEVDHFVNSNGNGTYRDPLNGNTRTSINPPTQGGQTRNF